MQLILALLNKKQILHFLLFVLVVLGTLYIYFFSGTTNFKEVKIHAEAEIEKIYSSLENVSNNENLNINNVSIEEFKTIEEDLPFDLFVYEKGELVFWNENKAIPDLNIASLNDTAKQISLNNGYYIALKKTKGDREYVALSLLRYSYNFVNKYLSNSFSKQFQFQDADVIMPIALEKGEQILDPNGNTIFRIQHNTEDQKNISKTKLTISILVLFFYFFLCVELVKFFSKKNKHFFGVVCLFFLGFLLYLLCYFIPFEFNKLVLFSPMLYGSKFLNSLGFLFIFSLYFLGVVYYIFINLMRSSKPFTKLIPFVLAIFSIFLYVFSSITLKNLVLDSVINFGPKNLSLFNAYAIFGLIVGLLVSLIFLLIHLSYLFTIKNNKFKIAIVVFQSVIVGLLLYYFNFEILSIGASFLFLLYSLLVFFNFKQSKSNRTVIIILLTLFFAVIQVSSLIREFSVQKQMSIKQTLASKKSRQRDVTAEDYFDKIASKIQGDALIKKFFKYPMISYSDVYKRMNFLYFGGYYSKFNVAITPFNVEGKAIKTKSSETLEDYYTIINKYGESTLNENLIFIKAKTYQSSYLSLLQIIDEKKIVGTLAIKISPKTYDIGNVYPELLLEGKNDLIKQYNEDFEYAVYIDNNLMSQSDEFAYVSNIENLKETAYFKDGYEHTVYTIDAHKKIIISSKKETLFDMISVFSFVLVFYLILGFFFVLIYFRLTSKLNKNIFNFSFRKRIAIAMLSLVLLSFFGIGLATVSYFSEQYNSYHKKRLIRKQKSIGISLKHLIEKNKLNTSERFYNYLLNSVNTDILEISDIHKMDLNIFNTEGQLLKSSQDGIFSSGLLSNIINPEAYVLLNNEQKSLLVQEENIGNLQYLSSYLPILDKQGKSMAFLNVPYFAKEKNLNQDISNFMISLINVYVLLLLIASIVAFFISNSITNPLKVISNKLKDIKLTQKNETINWKQDDEIGALVKEYNRMILQLEQNAKLLAKSERDSAWREMAKQIAHEIKNPLTPMKLSIQYLQNVLKDDKEKGADLAVKVSKTLIEQIDNLSAIATAFSSFAKMPKGDKVAIDLVEVINSAADLFKHDKINLVKEYAFENAIILADKNQMISVFNNLIKNAIQATDENEIRVITVKLTKENADYLVCITDNGIGITNEEKHKVFVPNFTTKSSGTGLGLAISKQIIENVDGDIWFESEYKSGTSFYVKLPKFVEIIN